MKSKNDPRHNARRLALTSVFCWLFSDLEHDLCYNLSKDLLDSPNTDYELTKEIVDGVKEHREEIDQIISKNAPEWPIDKIAKIDLVILRIAIFEALKSKKAPLKVVIDEAVELAKEFGNDTSSKFVNGVLGSISLNTKSRKNLLEE